MKFIATNLLIVLMLIVLAIYKLSNELLVFIGKVLLTSLNWLNKTNCRDYNSVFGSKYLSVNACKSL